MGKLIKFGYTDYFGNIQRVEILRYDNNKYVTVRLEDGQEDSVKRGYVKADPELKRSIPSINWHIHGGGKRKTFRPHATKTEYQVFGVEHNVQSPKFTSKAKAIAYAISLAKQLNADTQVWGTKHFWTAGSMGFHSGFVEIHCRPDGFAIQYGSGNRRRSAQPKFLRGYGKMNYGTSHFQ